MLDAATPTLVFATTNDGKLRRMREHLRRARAPARVDAWRGAAIEEIQANSVREVAVAKAALALERCDRACAGVVAHDCGLCVRALGGFPGPYTKDFNYRAGGDGLRALLDGAGAIDRSACWDETLVLAREGREMVVFTREKEYGDGEVGEPRKWTRWRDDASRSVGSVFVATGFGFDEPLADVSEDEYQRFRRDAPSVWSSFAAFVRESGEF